MKRVSLTRKGIFWILFLGLTAFAIGETKQDPDRLFKEAQFLFSSHEWTKAADQFAAFVQKFPDNPSVSSAAFLQGVCLFQAGKNQEALDLFQKFSRIWPTSPYNRRIPYWRGTSAYALGQFELAERELRVQSQFPAETPFFPRSLLTLALVQEKLDKTEEARESLEFFLQKSAEKDLRSQAWLRLGDLQSKKGQEEQALTSYGKSSSETPGSAEDFQARFKRLDLLIKGARIQEAKTLLVQTTELFPARKVDLLPFKAELARNLGNRSDARAALLELLKDAKDPAVAQKLNTNLALLADEENKSDSSLWERASVGPDKELAWQAAKRMAEVLEKKGALLEAAQALERWTKTRSSEESSNLELATVSAARLASRAEETVVSLKIYNRLVAQFSRSAQVSQYLLERGALLLASGDTDASLTDFQKILKDSPTFAKITEVRYQIGMVYMKRGEPMRAEGWFYGLIGDLKSGELYQRALLARGMCFANAGKTDLARASLQRLIREYPDGPWVGQAWYALGKNEVQDRQFSDAAQAFSQARQHLPSRDEQAQALWSAAEACVSQSEWEKGATFFGDYSHDFSDLPLAGQAVYRQGLCFYQLKNWDKSLGIWSTSLGKLSGEALRSSSEGMALAHLQQGDETAAWADLDRLEKAFPTQESVAGAWFRWAQTASVLGKADLATRAYQSLIEKHPESPWVESALPRAAGALLGSGNAAAALKGYENFFRRYGQKPSSAAVARTAASAALSSPDPSWLDTLVKASQTWNLSKEVATEFELALWKGRIDLEPDTALKALQSLSKNAPWSSQRSEAFLIAGQWATRQGKSLDARSYLEAAAGLGDELSVFNARLALAALTEKEGDLAESARQRETTERLAGLGVPDDFRVRALQEALSVWKKLGKKEDIDRVKQRLSERYPETGTNLYKTP